MITVTSPYSGDVVGTVPQATAADATRAIDGAVAAHARGALPQHERAEILERAASLIEARADAFAATICAEAGKPIAAARVEVTRAVDTLRWSAIEARTLAGEMVPIEGAASGANHLAYTQRLPVGVVVAISPFNFPLNLCCHKIGPAIAAGCPVVHKPASSTPLSAIALRDVFIEAGLPADQLTVVCGSGREVGDTLATDPRIALVTFTGSSAVGWGMRARVAPHVQLGLELGNSAPLIIHDDADVAAAVDAAVRGGYAYAGQSCVSVQRVLVHRSLHDVVVARLATAVAGLAAGDPADPEVTVGPVIDAAARDRILATIAAATAAGARVVTGGSADGNVVAPTLVADVTASMEIFQHEVFGPVVCVTPFDSDAEAIELANATPYGLQAGMFTASLTRAHTHPRQLKFAGVTVNEMPTFRADVMPYGGVKESGNTREGPRYAIEHMLEDQLVVIAVG